MKIFLQGLFVVFERSFSMQETFIKFMPMFAQGIMDTLYMTAMSAFFSYIIGLPMGVLLFITKQGGIAECKSFNAVFGWFINILRSIPFIILIPILFGLTRLIVGTAIGTNGAIVPLVVSCSPFVARMIESSLEETDSGIIEAAKSMGFSNFQIITRVVLVEAIPSIIRGVSITTITLIGYGAMAGVVGAGGLGKIAYSYGFQRFNNTIMNFTVILIIILVCIIQSTFDFCARKTDKRSR